MPWDRKRLLGYVEIIQLILGVTDKIFCMTSLNTICQNIKLKLVKMIRNFVKLLELPCDCLEVCVSAYTKYW